MKKSSTLERNRSELKEARRSEKEAAKAGVPYAGTSKRAGELEKRIASMERKIEKNREFAERAIINEGPRSDVRRVKGKTEILKILSSGTGTTLQTFLINPGNTRTFPDFSAEARLFTRYRLHKVHVKYVPATSAFGDAGKEGSIAIAWVSNIFDRPPNDIDEVFRMTRRSPIVVPCEPTSLTINSADMDRTGNRYMTIENADGVGDFDPLTSYCGRLLVYWEGIVNAATAGRIEVDYEFELFNRFPNLAAGAAVPIAPFRTLGHCAVGQTVTSAGWNQVNMATNNAAGVSDMKTGLTPIDVAPMSISGNQLSLKPGNYIIQAACNWQCTAPAMTVLGIRMTHAATSGSLIPFDANTPATGQYSISGVWPLAVTATSNWHLSTYQTFSSGTTTLEINWTVTLVS